MSRQNEKPEVAGAASGMCVAHFNQPRGSATNMERFAMFEYTIITTPRNRRRKRVSRLRSVRWHGPRFIRGRRATRLTIVWALKPRRVMHEVPA
jgi:hypothetical protein